MGCSKRRGRYCRSDSSWLSISTWTYVPPVADLIYREFSRIKACVAPRQRNGYIVYHDGILTGRVTCSNDPSSSVGVAPLPSMTFLDQPFTGHWRWVVVRTRGTSPGPNLRPEGLTTNGYHIMRQLLMSSTTAAAILYHFTRFVCHASHRPENFVPVTRQKPD